MAYQRGSNTSVQNEYTNTARIPHNDFMGSMLSNASDAIIVKELLRLCNGVDTSNFSSILRSVPNVIIKAISIFLVKYITSNGNLTIILRLVFSFLIPFVSRKRELNPKDQKDSAFISAYGKCAVGEKSRPNVAIIQSAIQDIFLVDSGQVQTLTYIPLVHSSILNDIDSEAQRIVENNRKLKDGSVPIICLDGEGRHMKPTNVYPSSNCKKLEEAVCYFLDDLDAHNLDTVFSVLINGVPGLGKSNSLCHFYHNCARKMGIGEIIHMNFYTSLSTFTFNYIRKSIMSRNVDHTVMYFIDELDKYVVYRINVEYQEEKKKNPDLKLEEYIMTYKVEFLRNLNQLLDTKNFPAGVIFVFCSNNFKSMFSDVKSKHHDNLSRRFTEIEFKPCDREELAGYMRWYNEQFLKTQTRKPRYVDPEQLEREISRLKPNLRVTYSTISTCSRVCHGDMAMFVDTINDYKKLDLFDEKSESVEVKEDEKKVGTVVCSDLLLDQPKPDVITNDEDLEKLQEMVDEMRMARCERKRKEREQTHPYDKYVRLVQDGDLDGAAQVLREMDSNSIVEGEGWNGVEEVPLLIQICRARNWYDMNYDHIEIIFQNGVDVNRIWKDKPLFSTCIVYLIERGISTRQRDVFVKILELFRSAGADLISDEVIMFKIFSSPTRETFDYFLSIGMDPKMKINGKSLLSVVTKGEISRNDHDDTIHCIEELLARGADPNGVSDGVSDISSIKSYSYPAIVNLYLKYGFDPKSVIGLKSVNFIHHLLYIMGCITNDPFERLHESLSEAFCGLVAKGVDIHERNREGISPIVFASMSSFNQTIMISLMEAGADPEDKCPGGKKAIDYARGQIRKTMEKYIKK